MINHLQPLSIPQVLSETLHTVTAEVKRGLCSIDSLTCPALWQLPESPYL